MMVERKRYRRLRAARDRLVDLLGFARTWPLQDSTVGNRRLMVPFGQRADVIVDPGATDVHYQLRGPHRETVDSELCVGKGGATVLRSPPIDEDITFNVFACKVAGLPCTWLEQRAEIKVGLDTGLDAHILGCDLLDPRSEREAVGEPRVTDFGTPVEVQVVDAQEGVTYRLVALSDIEGEARVSTQDVLGKGPGHDIVLRSRPMLEDTVLGVRATKTFDSSENRPTQSSLLDRRMPLAVRPNPDLKITLHPSPVVDFAGQLKVTLVGGQSGVDYRLFARPVLDQDLVYDEIEGQGILAVPVPDAATVRVKRPERRHPWSIPTAFAPVGKPRTGTGDDLSWIWKDLRTDSLLIIQAEKEHRFESDSKPFSGTSTLELADAAVVLVAPDPTVRLRVEAPLEGSSLRGSLILTEGEPGVSYTLLDGAGSALDRPAYFHRTDLSDSPHRGIGRRRVGLDFVVRQNPPQDPVAPEVEVGAIFLGSEVGIWAVRARTGVGRPLRHTLNFPTLPKIQLQHGTIAKGTEARIQISASRVGDQYQPFLGDAPVRRARHGNGKDLVFVTEPVAEDTRIDLRVWQPKDPGHRVIRIVSLKVFTVEAAISAQVLHAPPLEPGATGALDPRLIDHQTSVFVALDVGATKTEYRLWGIVDGKESPFSPAAQGTGAPLELKTLPLSKDVDLFIYAGRVESSADPLRLPPTLPVKVRADRKVRAHTEPIVDHRAQVVVTVEKSQANVFYTPYSRELRDEDFLHGPADASGELSVEIRGRGSVRVRTPRVGSRGRIPDDFVARAAPVRGTGGPLRIQLGEIPEDSVILLRAHKEHTLAMGAPIQSAVALDQPLLVLVRPDADLCLALETTVDDGRHPGTLTLSGGQAGTQTSFHPNPAEVASTPGPYWHRPRIGIGELRLGADFVLVDDPVRPTVDLGPLPLGLELYGRALKVRTGLGVALSRAARLPEAPDIRLEPNHLKAGAEAEIRISAAHAGDIYRPSLNGRVLAPGQEGQGGTLVFRTGPLRKGDCVAVHITRPSDPGHTVTRVVQLPFKISASKKGEGS